MQLTAYAASTVMHDINQWFLALQVPRAALHKWELWLLRSYCRHFKVVKHEKMIVCNF